MTVTLSDDDYQRLLLAAQSDDMIVFCEICGSWMDRDDPRAATTDEFTGCWFAAICDPKYADDCYRLARPGWHHHQNEKLLDDRVQRLMAAKDQAGPVGLKD